MKTRSAKTHARPAPRTPRAALAQPSRSPRTPRAALAQPSRPLHLVIGARTVLGLLALIALIGLLAILHEAQHSGENPLRENPRKAGPLAALKQPPSPYLVIVALLLAPPLLAMATPAATAVPATPTALLVSLVTLRCKNIL